MLAQLYLINIKFYIFVYFAFWQWGKLQNFENMLRTGTYFLQEVHHYWKYKKLNLPPTRNSTHFFLVRYINAAEPGNSQHLRYYVS